MLGRRRCLGVEFWVFGVGGVVVWGWKGGEEGRGLRLHLRG